MTDSAVSIALGVSLVLFTGSLVVSAVLEGVRRLFNRRERLLFRSLGELLDGTPTPGADSRTANLYRTREFRTAVTGRERALMDGTRRTLRPWIGRDECSRLQNFGPRHVRPALAGSALCRSAEGPGGAGHGWADWPSETTSAVPTGDDETAAAARWFDDAMQPVTRSYRDRTRGWLFALGLVLAVAANVDVLAIGQTLWNEPEARDRLDAIAALCEGETADAQCDPGRLASELRSVPALPLGWPCPDDDASGAPTDCDVIDRFSDVGWLTGLGWLLTAVGVMLGAPFWFDVIRRATSVRGSR